MRVSSMRSTPLFPRSLPSRDRFAKPLAKAPLLRRPRHPLPLPLPERPRTQHLPIANPSSPHHRDPLLASKFSSTVAETRRTARTSTTRFPRAPRHRHPTKTPLRRRCHRRRERASRLLHGHGRCTRTTPPMVGTARSSRTIRLRCTNT